MVLVVIRTCRDCGNVYRRPAFNPDEKQDLRDGMTDAAKATIGSCDECWREQMVLMWEPRG